MQTLARASRPGEISLAYVNHESQRIDVAPGVTLSHASLERLFGGTYEKPAATLTAA